MRQVSPANPPACRFVLVLLKPELMDWGEYLIAVSIFRSLQYRFKIERSEVLQPEVADDQT